MIFAFELIPHILVLLTSLQSIT